MNYNFKEPDERMQFYKSSAWRGKNGTRLKVLERDGYECIWCKRDGLVTTKEMGKLEVDHIIELENCTYEQAIDPENNRTLCTAHHNERHNRFDGKHVIHNKWAEDERW